MAVYSVSREYVEKIKEFLREDCESDGDIGPHGMFDIMVVTNRYRGKVSDDVIDKVIDDAEWLEVYFMRCRHMARPIDKVLANGVIDNLGFY